MELALSRPNLKAALKRVRKNKGGPGIDGMKTEELLPYLWRHWDALRAQLVAGTYQPSPVRRHQIPKKWIRHRLRSLYLKQWKRGPTAYRRLRAFGAHPRVAAAAAANMHHRWKTSRRTLNVALPNSHFDALGLPRLGA